MDYAIALYFDSVTENKFNSIINAIADSGVNKYMLNTKIPPHITVSFFNTEQIDNIINELENNYFDFVSENVTWASLGVFIPQVLFAAPVLSEYLINICIKANQLITPFSAIGDSGRYLPYQWVPHTALALKMNQAELKMAFDVATKQFSAFSGKCIKLVLAECNPYKEIKMWDLT